MMKKVLVLMLVLGLCSAANATVSGFSLAVDGQDYDEYSMCECENIDIGIYNSIANNNQWDFFLAMVVADPQGGDWPGGTNVYSPPCVPSVPGWTYYGVTEYFPQWDLWYAQLTNGVPTDFYSVGTLADAEYHCNEAGVDVTILLIDGTDGSTVLDSLTIHQVPEPATMLLLGLGGLLLRRRK